MNGRWLVTPIPRPHARTRLVCFPYAGGGASLFRTWGRELPPSIEVSAVQPPGREDRAGEPALTDLRAVARSAAEAMAPLTGSDYVLFGHSMGALLAFETARTLRAMRCRAPRALLLSAHVAPHFAAHRERICDLSDDEFIDRLVAMEGTPRALFEQPELLSFFLPILRADFTACDTYELGDEPPLDVPFALFAGDADATMPAAEVDAWRSHTTAPCTFRIFPGGHFFLQSAREAVLAAVARIIDNEQGGVPSWQKAPPQPFTSTEAPGTKS